MALRHDELTSLSGEVDLDRDRALVERCQGGDASAFGDLYTRYYDRLFRFCLRRLHDRDEAEDVTQEAFARAWRALPNFVGERRFYPWLTVIAGNVCTDLLRRRSRNTPSADVEMAARQAGEATNGESSEDVVIAAVDGELVIRALDRLSDRHRHVLTMREGSGWTYQQMATHDGVEVGTIETLLWRARKALKREFTYLSQSKGVLGGMVLAGSDLLRRAGSGFARRANAVPSTGAGFGMREAVVAAAITTAAVTAAVVAPSHPLVIPPTPGTHQVPGSQPADTNPPAGIANGTPNADSSVTGVPSLPAPAGPHAPSTSPLHLLPQAPSSGGPIRKIIPGTSALPQGLASLSQLPLGPGGHPGGPALFSSGLPALPLNGASNPSPPLNSVGVGGLVQGVTHSLPSALGALGTRSGGAQPIQSLLPSGLQSGLGTITHNLVGGTTQSLGGLLSHP